MGQGTTVELISAPSLAQLKLMKASDEKRIEIIKTVAPRWLDIGDMLNFNAKGGKLRTRRVIREMNQFVGKCSSSGWKGKQSHGTPY